MQLAALSEGGESVPVQQEAQIDSRINFSLISDALQCTLIDDTNAIGNDRSLFYSSFSNFSCAAEIGKRTSFEFSTVVASDYFNVRKVSWEPLLENWTFKIVGKQENLESPMVITFLAEQMMNFNLTYSVLEVLSLLMARLKALQQNQVVKVHKKLSSTQEVMAHGKFVYHIVNNLGIPLQFSIEAEKSDTQWTLNPGEEVQLDSQKVQDMYMAGQTSYKNMGLLQNIQTPASISISTQEFKQAQGLVIEDIADFGFILQKDSYSIPAALNIYQVGTSKFVSIQSGITLMNNTQIPITLNNQQNELQLQPKHSLSVPIQWLISGAPTTVQTVRGPIAISQNIYIETAEKQYLVIENIDFTTKTAVHQTVIQFNPGYIIQNYLPCPITVNAPSPICQLAPAESFDVYSLNPVEVNQTISIEIHLPTGENILSEITGIDQEFSHVPIRGSFPIHKLTIESKQREFRVNQNLDLSYRELSPDMVEYHLMAKNLLIYSQFIINNKTDYQLEAGRRTSMVINPHSLGFFKSNRASIKIRAVQESGQTEWSEGFNVKTIGLSGVVKLGKSQQLKLEGQHNIVSPELRFGIRLMNASYPCQKSKVVNIVPRYIIKNFLSYPIYLKQYIPNRQASQIFALAPDDQIAYQFEHPSDLFAVQFSATQNDWSSPVNIETIEDLQISYKAENVGDFNEPLGKGINALVNLFKRGAQLKDWYLPSRLNDYKHFARIVISTEDDATIFVNVLHPKDPEFVINNMTNLPLEIEQKGQKFAIPPRVRSPWCIPNHLEPSEKVKMWSGRHSNTYTLQRVKKLKNLGPYSVQVEVKGVTREIQVKSEEAEPLSQFNILKFIGQDTFFKRQFKFYLSIEGVGFSIVDNTPKEAFFISIRGIQFKLRKQDEGTVLANNSRISLTTRIRQFQIDNMHNENAMFPVILQSRVLEGSEDQTPFFQTKIVRNTEYTLRLGNRQEYTAVDKFECLQISMQEMKLQLNQEILYVFSNLAFDLQELLLQQHIQLQDYPREPIPFDQICPELLTDTPTLSYNASQISNKAYLQYGHLGAIKCFLTFRRAKQGVEGKINPLSTVGGVIGVIGGSVMNISDSPLYFSELVFTDSFQTVNNLMWLIIKNYIRQAIMRFYNLIGSSDMLGNPVGLIDKLGSGVFEFINEPRKGLLKGPKGFVQGVGKGVKSLVGNVVSGGFGSVSKITGNLYGVVRELGYGKEDEGQDRIEESKNVFQGFYHGIKGGAKDISEGVSGLFTKPYRGAKQGGTAGFFKGMGKGLLGAVASPFSAILRVGTSISSGAAKSGTLLAYGKVSQFGRVRFPRQFGAKRILEPYNAELAQAQELLRGMKQFENESMVFYLHLQEKEDVIIIVTVNVLLLLVEAELVRQLTIKDVVKMEVHRYGAEFVIAMETRTEQLVIKSKSYGPLAKLFTAVKSLPNSLTNERVNMMEVKSRHKRGYCGL